MKTILGQSFFLLLSLTSNGCVSATLETRPSENSVDPKSVAHPPQDANLLPIATLTATEGDVLEAVFRHSLHAARTDEVVFISLGSDKWKDPDAQFLKRFGDLSCSVRPVSAARLPRIGEKDAPNRLRGVEDPATGKRSRIYFAEILEWTSNTRVRVKIGVYSGPLDASGGIAVYEKLQGRWGFVENEPIRWKS
jgi:hypothetical protein